jgi:hypothetical protein
VITSALAVLLAAGACAGRLSSSDGAVAAHDGSMPPLVDNGTDAQTRADGVGSPGPPSRALVTRAPDPKGLCYRYPTFDAASPLFVLFASTEVTCDQTLPPNLAQYDDQGTGYGSAEMQWEICVPVESSAFGVGTFDLQAQEAVVEITGKNSDTYFGVGGTMTITSIDAGSATATLSGVGDLYVDASTGGQYVAVRCR